MNPLTREYAAEIDYLLHRMTPEDRERFGHRVVEDQESFDRVREAEVELYDARARGNLPEALRADFERHLLATPEQRQRLRAAEMLAARRRERRVPPVVWWAVAASLLLGLAAVPRWWRFGSEPGVAVLQLRLGQTRSAAAIPEFAVPSGAATEIRVAWDPAEPPREYVAEVARQGVSVWRGPVRPEGDPPELRLRLPAGVLRPGSHELAVRGPSGEPVGFAEFRVP